MELADIIALICVILAVLLAIFSAPIRESLLDMLGPIADVVIFVILAGLLIIVIGAAIYGQRISRA